MDLGALAAKGWTPDGKRMIHRGGKAKELVLEERDPQTLWLWIVGTDDKRCLGLEPGEKLAEVLDAIASMQAELSIDDYLSHYLALQQVCDVSIIAWEHFEERSAPAAFGKSESKGKKKKW